MMTILEADQFHGGVCGGLEAIDVVLFACQSMWHLKDWIRNDSNFGAKDIKELEKDVHASQCLLVCADLANGSKHLSLKNRKVDARLLERSGIRYDSSTGIFRELYYVVCRDRSNQYHGMEVRDLLRRCRDEWQRIISRYYLSKVEDNWPAFVNDLTTDHAT